MVRERSQSSFVAPSSPKPCERSTSDYEFKVDNYHKIYNLPTYYLGYMSFNHVGLHNALIFSVVVPDEKVFEDEEKRDNFARIHVQIHEILLSINNMNTKPVINISGTKTCKYIPINFQMIVVYYIKKFNTTVQTTYVPVTQYNSRSVDVFYQNRMKIKNEILKKEKFLKFDIDMFKKNSGVFFTYDGMLRTTNSEIKEIKEILLYGIN